MYLTVDIDQQMDIIGVCDADGTLSQIQLYRYRVRPQGSTEFIESVRPSVACVHACLK